jgi:hypothetical protein
MRAQVVIGAAFGNDTKMAGDMMTLRIARSLLVCAMAALGACHQDAAPPPVSSEAPQVKKAPALIKHGPSAAELTAGMVEAASAGKSQAPVDLKFELVQRPKVGQPLDINLALVPHVDAGAAAIQLIGAEGYTIAAGSNQFEIASMEADQVYRQTVNLTPTAAGVLIIAVSVALKHDEITDLKAFSIPIIADR